MTDEVRRTRIQSDLSNEDYVAFCGLKGLAADGSDLEQVDVSVSNALKLRPTEAPTDSDLHCPVQHFAQANKERALVVDVRPQVEYEIAHLQPSTSE